MTTYVLIPSVKLRTFSNFSPLRIGNQEEMRVRAGIAPFFVLYIQYPIHGKRNKQQVCICCFHVISSSVRGVNKFMLGLSLEKS